MMKKLNMKSKKGFTLIELIVVMAVIAILVLLATPKFMNYTREANVTSMKADIKTLSNAALLYSIDNNEDGESVYPVEENVFTEDLDKLEEYIVKAYDEVNEEAVEAINFYKLDNNKIGSYYKSLKNDIEEYVIVTGGELEGEVFHINGQNDKDNVPQHGIETVAKTVEETPEP